MVTQGKTRILIVEDEPDIAGLMKHALERGGELEVEVVTTGAAALKSVMEAPPGLVLLDLNLPFIDGLEVCRLLRGRAASATIPIIMVTARTERDGSRRRSGAGRRRLRHQAIQSAGARRARARSPAPAAPDRSRAESRLPARAAQRSISTPCPCAYPARRSG